MAAGSEPRDQLSTEYAGRAGDEHSHWASRTLMGILDRDSVEANGAEPALARAAARAPEAVQRSPASKIKASATSVPCAIRAHAGR